MHVSLPESWERFIARHPLVPIASVFVIAIALHRHLPVSPFILALVAFALLIASVVIWRRGFASSILTLSSIFLIGLALAHLAHYRFRDDDIANFIPQDSSLIQARIQIDDEPRLRHATFGLRSASPPRLSTLATTRELLTHDGWKPVTGRVLLQVNQYDPRLRAGQVVQVVGTFERPSQAANPGQFDWSEYYRQQRVLVSIQVRKSAAIQIIQDNPPSMLSFVREQSRALLASGFDPEDSLDHALVRALVLGDYDPELRDVRELFRATGTSHHLAISGMHVAIVGGTVFLVFRLFSASVRQCWIAATLTVILYGIVATPSPPVWRSVLLFVSAAGSYLMRRHTPALQLLALSVLLMLMLYPLDLFNAGFQLSFVTVLGLMVLSNGMLVKLGEAREPERREEAELLPMSERIARHIDRGFLRILAAGLVAWLVSMPLITLHFDRLNPWQVVASILLAPVVTLTLIAGVVKIPLTFLMPSLDFVFADITAWCSSLMRGGVGLLARLPASDIPLPAPPLWLAGACWVTLILALLPWKRASARLVSMGLMALTFGAMILAPYLGDRAYVSSGSLRVTLLSVGAGQCSVIEPPGGRVTMFDCGSNTMSDLISSVVSPFLRAQSITQIDTVFISHADTDHFSGAADVTQAYDVREVLIAPQFERFAIQTDQGEQLMELLAEMNRPPRVIDAGDSIPLGAKTRVEVLWPHAELKIDQSNDASSVLRLTHADKSILFTGDIQDDAMRALLESNIDLRSDVLIAPHHGSSETLTQKFINAVNPRFILSSNDRGLSGKQQRLETLVDGRQLLRTNQYGAITIVIDESGMLSVEPFLRK